ncbi:MAG: glycosyltransferase family 4 protein [Jatrophihabitantaceae bacterium]
MRIAHVSDCYLPRLGGIERQVHDLAVRQQRAGHEVHVITSVSGEHPGEHEGGFGVRRPAGRSGDADRIRYESTRAGRDAVLAGGFDVVHVHASNLSPLAFLSAASASRAGVPTALTLHSLWAYAEPLYAGADLAMRWRRWPVAWSAVSSVAAEPLQRVLGPRARVSVLPNGVDPQSWRVAARPRDPARVVVVNVGRLAERKRPRQLLRMLLRARRLVPAGIRLEAVLIGDGPMRARLQRLLDRTGMDGWVRLAGAADHAGIRTIYEDADFYVAPARLESFGIAALEARSAGLPVIAHARSGIADFVTDRVEGLLTRDDADMTRRIVELATDASTLARLREHNLQVAPAVTWAGVLRECDALYERACVLAGTLRASRLDSTSR